MIEHLRSSYQRCGKASCNCILILGMQPCVDPTTRLHRSRDLLQAMCPGENTSDTFIHVDDMNRLYRAGNTKLLPDASQPRNTLFVCGSRPFTKSDPGQHCERFWLWLKAKGITAYRHDIVLAIAEKVNVAYPGEETRGAGKWNSARLHATP